MYNFKKKNSVDCVRLVNARNCGSSGSSGVCVSVCVYSAIGMRGVYC